MPPFWLKDVYSHNFECGSTTLKVIYTLLHVPQFSELYNGDNSYLPGMHDNTNKVVNSSCINNGLILMYLKYSGTDVLSLLLLSLLPLL